MEYDINTPLALGEIGYFWAEAQQFCIFKLTEEEAYRLTRASFGFAIDCSVEENISIIAQQLKTGIREPNSGLYIVSDNNMLKLNEDYTGYVLIWDGCCKAYTAYLDGFITKETDPRALACFCRSNHCSKTPYEDLYLIKGSMKELVTLGRPTAKVLDAILNGEVKVELSEEEVTEIKRVIGSIHFSKIFRRSRGFRRRQK